VLEGQGDAAPEVKAHHAEAAGLTERALDCWEQAGMQALARPAYKEAIASLEKGIRLSSALGEDPQWKRRELGQVQLGQAPATLRTFERALVLVDATGDVSLEFLALYGQWASYYVAGRSSVELAQRFVRRAEAHLETGPRLNGLRILGLERFHEGPVTIRASRPRAVRHGISGTWASPIGLPGRAKTL
jgi:tetratricopeptide (TPR) repeat protein